MNVVCTRLVPSRSLLLGSDNTQIQANFHMIWLWPLKFPEIIKNQSCSVCDVSPTRSPARCKVLYFPAACEIFYDVSVVVVQQDHRVFWPVWSPETEAICRAAARKTASTTHRASVAVIDGYFLLLPGWQFSCDGWLVWISLVASTASRPRHHGLTWWPLTADKNSW